MNSRTGTFFVAALAVAALANATVDQLPDASDEYSFAKATEFVQSFMAQNENDETACEKVATAAIKAIQDECSTLQKDVDERAKDNDHCCGQGKDGIDAAKAAHKKSEESHVKCTGELATTKQEKVDFGKISYESLNENQCKATFFNSPVYQAQHKKVNEKQNTCTKIDGETSGLKQAVLDAENGACVARGKCYSDAEAARDKAYTDSHNSCSSQKNKDAFTRAHHMLCVLQGKSLQSCSVPTGPTIKKTAMDKHECTLKCNIFKSAEGTNCNHGGVKGFRILQTCGHGKVGLLMLAASKWEPNKVYHCPAGWYWPTDKQYYDRLKANGCEGNNGKSTTDGHAYYNQCGLSSYTLPNNGKYAYRFRFKDSKTTNTYQHAGNYPGYRNTGDSNVNEFAGIPCMKN